MPTDELFDQLDELAAEGECEEVERRALDALREEPGEQDLWIYVAWARFEQGRLRRALEAAREADDALWIAKSLFHLWQFEEAQRALDDLVADGEDAAEVEWYRGLLAEFAGDDAAPFFRRAAELAPDVFVEPVDLPLGDVEAVLATVVEALPPDIAEIVRETVVEVPDLPKPHPDVDPLSLGLYIGTSRLERSLEQSGRLPPHIELYRRNIARIAHDREEAIDELRITLLHEIAHHLGYDEGGVVSLGLG